MSIGARLKEERLRIGLSQAEIAALGGLSNKTQLSYESDTRSPDANYLAALAKIGVDVLYVITGERSVQSTLPSDEADMLDSFRQLNDIGRAAVQGAINGYLHVGEMTLSGQSSKRIPRIAANRMAKLDAFVEEEVKAAQANVEQTKRQRVSRKRGQISQD
ncbi:helix-turn-helix domain-containing protein [Burkholderia multivorans]|uniref:helix-turn-helix domain-containing protein n=1 Tax=Burkholderia multivorans TaxID=87883 RepID=UPI001C22E6C2|nr:helix-turn-helix transcriptional regulator [Burkholderia multivorans]MBU9606027.1 helix-turn-helix domain-containing protein [Burkholderia multivorans]MCO8425438.1 helix-turn-helix domain-containing protein [Burkholderia multivorans]MCO8440749.1 helix-turn-helix domain-containing protein [Burkholderia multivorans]MCO8544997.1 helix-turn-helix domain-containing protein [Burkholderia multivorans]MCO8552701.1 helix-turn-helix domain-containing protein [Burkholderia multivorans]